MSTTILRDPTAENIASKRKRVDPPASLEGKTIALLDIGKMRGDEFIDRLDQLFTQRGIPTRRYKKPTNTRTAPQEIIQAIVSEADVVVIALSDCGSCTSCSTHDLNDLDVLGIPGVSILTEGFRSAFDLQCKNIGFAGASLYTPHPMQNKSTAELHQYADQIFEDVLSAITTRV